MHVSPSKTFSGISGLFYSTYLVLLLLLLKEMRK